MKIIPTYCSGEKYFSTLKQTQTYVLQSLGKSKLNNLRPVEDAKIK